MKKPSLMLRLKAAIAIAKAGVAILRDLSLVAPPIKAPSVSKRRQQQAQFDAKIPAKALVAVQQPMQTLFRGTRLVVPRGAQGTSIVALFVGNKYQFPTVDLDGGLDCTVLAPGVPDPGLVLDTCTPGMCITFWVRNNTDQDIDWSMVLFGDTIQ